MRRILLPLLILLLAPSAFANPSANTILQPYQLTYTAQYNGMDVAADRTFKQQQDGSYQLQTSAKNFFASIVETGTFQLSDEGSILNDSYQYKRSVLGSKKTENLVYDRASGFANYKSKDKKRQVSLTDPALNREPLNRLSYQFQLRQDLLNQCEELEYAVISRGKLKTYRFERSGEELLDTPLGAINTIKVKRVREDNDRETVLWFAPDLNYLLVKLWQREKDGEEYHITLKQGQLNGQPLAVTEATTND